VGYDALASDDVGFQSTAVGAQALYSQNTSSAATVANSGLGYQAGYYNVTGVNNTCIGFRAGFGVSGQSNTSNTFIGVKAGFGIETGDNNTSIGENSGLAISSGDSNNFIGKDAGDNVTTGSQNICIGQNSNTSQADGTKQIVIGHDILGVGSSYMTVGTGASTSRYQLNFTADGGWARSSDERFKKDISSSEIGLDFINAVRPVNYKWKAPSEIDESLPQHNSEITEPDNTDTMSGFIAQEVKAAMDEHNASGFRGWTELDDGTQAIGMDPFVPVLVKAVQELSAQVTALQAEVNTLKGG